MAFSAHCTSCGTFSLTVRGPGGRRCCACVLAAEFEPGPKRRARGFLKWRVRLDDRLDDRQVRIDDQREEPGGREEFPTRGSR